MHLGRAGIGTALAHRERGTASAAGISAPRAEMARCAIISLIARVRCAANMSALRAVKATRATVNMIVDTNSDARITDASHRSDRGVIAQMQLGRAGIGTALAGCAANISAPRASQARRAMVRPTARPGIEAQERALHITAQTALTTHFVNR